jgi:hypothetical protein
MRASIAALALLVLSSIACKKTADGKIEATTPTIDIDIGTRKDTLTLPKKPDVTTKPETVIVNRPVVKPPPKR